MGKLLKATRVFVDTNEFSVARFDMRDPSFTELRKLCENRQLILLTRDITRREIEAGIKLHAAKAPQSIMCAAQPVHLRKETQAPTVGSLGEKSQATVFADARSRAVEGYFRACSTTMAR